MASETYFPTSGPLRRVVFIASDLYTVYRRTRRRLKVNYNYSKTLLCALDGSKGEVIKSNHAYDLRMVAVLRGQSSASVALEASYTVDGPTTSLRVSALHGADVSGRRGGDWEISNRAEGVVDLDRYVGVGSGGLAARLLG